MRGAVSHTVLAFLSIAVLAACGEPAPNLSEAQPAAGPQLQEFARAWNDGVNLAAVTPLLQRYCMNMSGERCAPDTAERLGQYGFKDGGASIDLAYAFIGMAADMKDGVSDQTSSDEDFIASCYRVMFGREPDAEGAAHHLVTIGGKGVEARKGLVTAFLRSPEFVAQK